MHIATRAEDQFRLTADQLRAAITPKTKLLIFPYPNNPTGAVMIAAEMEEIAAVLRETNVVILSDEIYSELTYGLDRHVSHCLAARLAERTIGRQLLKSRTPGRLAAGLRCGSCTAIKVMTKIFTRAASLSASPPASAAAITASLHQCDDQRSEMMRDEYETAAAVM